LVKPFKILISKGDRHIMSEEGKIESLTVILRDQIKREEYGTRGRLPSVSQLAKTNQVARSTVYQALLLLQAEGLVIARHNSFFVNPVLRISTNPTPTFEQMLVSQGLEPFVQNITDPEIIVMPDEIAIIFNQPAGQQVIHRYRVQGKTDIPFRLSEYWYPEQLAKKYLEEMRDDPSYDVLDAIKKDMGIKRQLVHDDVLSRIPTKQEATLLSITRTSSVQEVRRTNRTPDGTVLMYHRIVFVGPYNMLAYDYELVN
jgi:GntR family transcriptional regulator